MSGRVMTVLEARVAPDRWDQLRRAFEEGRARLPTQMVHAYLVQSAAEPTLWRGISVWHSRESLTAYQQSVETPGGVLMFRMAGAEPTLSLFDVAIDFAV
ncbi:MAG TPA: antibiotic biosynthesis monooxygenase [Ktedonobacterales bacterium]